MTKIHEPMDLKEATKPLDSEQLLLGPLNWRCATNQFDPRRNDADASATIAALATRLGFAPIELGRLDKGGVPLHAVTGKPGGLLFQNVEKLIGENYE